MCKKRKTSVTHSKTTHINKIASPRRRQWWEGRKKNLHLGHTFFVFSLPSTRGKPTSVLWMKFVWVTKISKWSRCYTSVLRKAVQAWSPWEEKKYDMPDRPCLSAGEGMPRFSSRGAGGRSVCGPPCPWPRPVSAFERQEETKWNSWL